MAPVCLVQQKTKLWKNIILNDGGFLFVCFLLKIKVSHKSNSFIISQSASQSWICYFLLLILLPFGLFAFLT